MPLSISRIGPGSGPDLLNSEFRRKYCDLPFGVAGTALGG